MRFLCPVRVEIKLRIPIYWAPWESHPSLRDTQVYVVPLLFLPRHCPVSALLLQRTQQEQR